MASIRLRVLGRVVVERDGALVRGRAAQSHHLALLAFLAASPGRTASRDKLIGYLWPERGSAKARHRLSVALHAIRRGLGQDAVVTTGDAVTLNPTVVWTDVGEFLDAVDAGRLEDAVTVCAGPFLDGFYLKDGPEFEEWADGERNRLAGLCRSALVQLAEEAEAAGDLKATVEWRRRLADVSPYDASVTISLMEALAAQGDIAGAIAHARAYRTHVDADLGIPPNPAVGELADRLSAEAEARALVAPALGSGAGGALSPPPATPSPPSPEPASPSATGATTKEQRDGRPIGQLVTIAAGGLMVVAAAWSVMASGAGSGGEGVESVVVIPFVDTGDVALGADLAAEVGSTLAIVPNLIVRDVGTASVPPGRWRRVAQDVRASRAITGSVFAEEGRAWVSVQLLNVATGDTLWQTEHARALPTVAALSEALSMAIADDLRTRLARYIPHHYTDSEAANEAFLTAVYEHQRYTEQRIWVALQHYRRGWEEDPSFALSHAIAGSAYMGLSQNFGLAPEVGWERGREHVMRAIELDPTLPEAYSVLGRLQLWWDHDCSAAEATLRRAIMLYPTHPDARTWYGYYQLYCLEDLVGAEASVRLALEFDPLMAARSNDIANVLLQSRRYEEALEQIARTWELDPEMAPTLTPYRAAQIYRWAGRYEESVAEYEAVHRRVGGATPTGLGVTYALMGRTEDARAILREYEERAGPEGPRGTGVAQLYAALGETERALDVLEQAVDDNPTIYNLKTNQGFDPLRSEPRFQALLRRMGLSAD